MPDSNIDQKDPYFVAVKVFLEKDGKFLVLKDNFGDWDIPGGRIKKDEFAVSLEDIVRRKMKEEVGEGVTYVLGKPEVFMRHERVEQSPGNPTVHIFALGYRAQWVSGEVGLSHRHTELVWADPATFVPEDYFTGGWLAGVKEYVALCLGTKE